MASLLQTQNLARFLAALAFAGLMLSTAKAQNTVDPLASVVIGMRDAQQRLENKDFSIKTRTVQQGVVTALDQLILAAQQQEHSPRPMPVPKKQEMSKADQPPPSNQPPGPSPAPQENSSRPGDSAPRKSGDQKTDGEIKQRNLEQGVWGHLPQRLRDKLRQRSSEKYLPKYDELVRRYFQALAEEGQALDQSSSTQSN